MTDANQAAERLEQLLRREPGSLTHDEEADLRAVLADRTQKTEQLAAYLDGEIPPYRGVSIPDMTDADRLRALRNMLETAIRLERRRRGRNAELRADRDRLAERVERADQTIANSAEIIAVRDTRIRELEGKTRAIRSHIRVHQGILSDRQRENPQSGHVAAKLQMLDQIAACLDHMHDEPPAAAAPCRAENEKPCGIPDAHRAHQWIVGGRPRNCPGVETAPGRAEESD